MIIHIDGDMLFYELTTPSERKRIISLFFEKIDEIISQNHVYKFTGPEKIECILNNIALDFGLELVFKYRKIEEDFAIHYEIHSIYFLQEVLDEFKVRYRFSTKGGC